MSCVFKWNSSKQNGIAADFISISNSLIITWFLAKFNIFLLLLGIGIKSCQ